jgi:hypothetical protein
MIKKVNPLKRCLLLFVILFVVLPVFSLFAQNQPRYAFIGFGDSYDRILGEARKQEYTVKEEEIKAAYGTHFLLLEKELQFYREELSLFFNQGKELIYFSVHYVLKENHSQTIIEKLIRSLGAKLVEKYGPNERETAPYYRLYENNYEVFLYPTGPAPEVARLSFKQLDRYTAYLDYYRLEVEKLENQEIAETVEKL